MSQRIRGAVAVGATVAIAAASRMSAATTARAVGRDSATFTTTVGLAPHVRHRVTTATRVSSRAKGALRPTHVSSSAARANAPRIAAAGPRVTGPTLENFNGTSSRDSEVTNFNARFEPPDQGLCEGDGYVLEAVNSAYTIFRTDGRVVRGPFNVNDLFDEGAKEFTSDPRCVFDASTDTWFATILFISADGKHGRLDLAVNATGDPTGLWQEYQIDTTDAGGLGCPCFGDQPRIGIDGHNIYVTTDEFSILGHRWNGAQIYAIAKSDLVHSRAKAHFVHFGDVKVDGDRILAPQPALTTGGAPAEYLMGSLDLNGAGDHRLDVWALTGAAQVASGGTPTLSGIVVKSEAYAFPPPARQRSSTTFIDSGDDRMQQTQYIGGRLWGELTTAVTVASTGRQHAGAAWFALAPRLAGGMLSAAPVRRQGYVGGAGSDLIYPALQADAAGRAAMVFTATGPGRYPSAAYALLDSGAPNFGPVTISAAGTGPYDPHANRWGDYSWATLDSHADAVWMATEYVPPLASQTSTRARNWGTRVVEVALS